MGIQIIKMPDIGEGIAEVELVAWHVKAGDIVTEDQILADVMTDKATVEIPSPVTGTVLALGGTVGQVMAVGSEVIRIEVAGSGNAKAAAATQPEPVPVTAVAASQVQAAPVAPTTAPVASADGQADVEAAVKEWAKAWSTRNMSAYLGAYAPNFTPGDGQTRKGWEADRKARIVPRKSIDVGVSNFTVTVNGDRATAKFRQAYNSDNLNVTSRKQLDMVKSGGRWLIVREATGS